MPNKEKNIYERALEQSKFWRVDSQGRIYKADSLEDQLRSRPELQSHSEELRKLLEYIRDNMPDLMTPYYMQLLNDEKFRVAEIRKATKK